jgi:hypothetical protein
MTTHYSVACSVVEKMPARGQSGGLTPKPAGVTADAATADSATEVVGDLATLFAQSIAAIFEAESCIFGLC